MVARAGARVEDLALDRAERDQLLDHRLRAADVPRRGGGQAVRRPARRGTSPRSGWDRSGSNCVVMCSPSGCLVQGSEFTSCSTGNSRPGEERRLFAGVPPCVGGPQFPHQVDDAVQFRGLEGQEPFVVAERERRHRVGPDVLVLAGGHAVFGEHAATLLVGQQIPLIGPHERVDADVGARLFAGQKRRDVALVEFGRPVQRDAAPHRRRRAGPTWWCGGSPRRWLAALRPARRASRS